MTGSQPPRADTWTIRTDVFEGPLDLLLHLVKRDGIDINRLPISHICAAYLEYLDKLKALHLELAAEYLVMAATLVHLKSLSLLPRLPTPATEDGEPDEDPTEALARQLEAYAKVKAHADALHRSTQLGRDAFAREPAPIAASDRPVSAGIDAFELLDLYFGLLSRYEEGPPVHTLPDDGPDLLNCCQSLVAAVGASPDPIELGGFLRTMRSVAQRVVTFIATLEMVRLGWLGIRQTSHLGDVSVWFAAKDQIDLELLTGRLAASEDDEGEE